MNKIKTAALLLWVAIIPASCVRDGFGNDGSTGGEVSYAFTDVTVPGRGSAGTRALQSGGADLIKEITLFAFDATSGDILVYQSNAGTDYAGKNIEYHAGEGEGISWLLPASGTPFDVYAVMNMGDLSGGYTNVSELREDARLMIAHDEASLQGWSEAGMPMGGIAQEVLGGAPLHLSPVRTVARYTLTLKDLYDESSGATYRLASLSVDQANGTVHLFGEDEAADTEDYVSYQASESDLIDLNNGTAVTLFVPENMATTTGGFSLPGNDDWTTASGLLGSHGCTYISLVFEEVNSQSVHTVARELVLGKDCKSDFDVERNRGAKLSIRVADQYAFEFSESGFGPDSGWDDGGVIEYK